MRTDMKSDRKKHAMAVTAVTVITILEAAVLAAFAWWQIKNYELGVAEIYAMEQDGYVEVVANQITRYGEVAGSDFVKDTINFLDSTSSRYWTLDNTSNFLFVKSVNETNVYKSFSTDTFFNTESSQEFLSELKFGEVTHRIITLDGYKYIASGIMFRYNGTDYRLCLLTDYEVMLSNNTYLSSKLYLVIDFMLMIALLSISIIYFVIRYEKERAAVEREIHIKKKLNRYVEFLNSVVMGRNGTLIIAGKGQILRLFHRLDERGNYPIAFVFVHPGAEQMMDFYEEGRQKLNDRVIWVRYGTDEYILLVGNMTGEEAAALIKNELKEAGPLIVRTDTATAERPCMTVYAGAIKNQGDES